MRRPRKLTPLSPECRALAADPELHRLARLACRLVPPRLREDAEAAALLALCRAAQAFDPARRLPFRAWAAYKIRLAVRQFLRDERPAGQRRQAAWAATESLGGREPAAGELPVGWEAAAEDEVGCLLRHCLGPRQEEALRLRFLHADCASFEAAAERMGCTSSNACNYANRGLAEIHAALAPVPEEAP